MPKLTSKVSELTYIIQAPSSNCVYLVNKTRNAMCSRLHAHPVRVILNSELILGIKRQMEEPPDDPFLDLSHLSDHNLGEVSRPGVVRL